jgi:hypothetical protein
VLSFRKLPSRCRDIGEEEKPGPRHGPGPGPGL